jgi:hypothetical protein
MDPQPPQFGNRPIAIGFEHLKPRRRRMAAAPDPVLFRNQCANADAFERASRQARFEARIEDRDRDQRLVVSHVEVQYRRPNAQITR